jgi:hypothetical protein
VHPELPGHSFDTPDAVFLFAPDLLEQLHFLPPVQPASVPDPFGSATEYPDLFLNREAKSEHRSGPIQSSEINYPPGFAILSCDDIQIFLQQQPGYVAPDDPGRRERHAWNVYIVTDDVKALYEEYSALSGVKISRRLCPQDYGMMEFDVMDLNGYRLVFAQPVPAE